MTTISSQRPAVSPELLALCQQIIDNPFPDDLEESRGLYESMTADFPTAEDVSSERSTLGGRVCEWFRPEYVEPEAGCILYLHGGGFSIGSVDTHRHVTSELARLTSLNVVSLDYRLAPEHPFPAGVDDTVAAYRELLDLLPPEKILFAGDSAGGGIAVQALLAIRDKGLPTPGGAYLQSPWVDLACDSSAMDTKEAHDPIASRRYLLMQAARYIADHDPRAPDLNALHADLTGLPALFIQVGEAEVLLDDSLELAARAARAGVNVQLEAAAGMIHVYPFFFPTLPEGRSALERAAAWLAGRVA